MPTAQAELEADEVVPRLLSLQEMDLMQTFHQQLEHWKPDYIIIFLPAFGSNLYLNLTRGSAVISNSTVIEERLGNQSVLVRRLTRNQHCFYSGFIINQTHSVASLSTCAGLVNHSSVCVLSVERCAKQAANQVLLFKGAVSCKVTLLSFIFVL